MIKQIIDTIISWRDETQTEIDDVHMFNLWAYIDSETLAENEAKSIYRLIQTQASKKGIECICFYKFKDDSWDPSLHSSDFKNGSSFKKNFIDKLTEYLMRDSLDPFKLDVYLKNGKFLEVYFRFKDLEKERE